MCVCVCVCVVYNVQEKAYMDTCPPFLSAVYKGLTTYEYIVSLREKEGYQDAENHKQATPSNTSRPATFRVSTTPLSLSFSFPPLSLSSILTPSLSLCQHFESSFIMFNTFFPPCIHFYVALSVQTYVSLVQCSPSLE